MKKARGSRSMGVRAAVKAFVVCQPKKVSILPARGEIYTKSKGKKHVEIVQ